MLFLTWPGIKHARALSPFLRCRFTDLHINYHSFTQLRLVLMDYPELHWVSNVSLFSTLFTSNLNSLRASTQSAFLTAPHLVYLQQLVWDGDLTSICWMNDKKLHIFEFYLWFLVHLELSCSDMICF